MPKEQPSWRCHLDCRWDKGLVSNDHLSCFIIIDTWKLDAGSVMTERLYIDIKHDEKKKNEKKNWMPEELAMPPQRLCLFAYLLRIKPAVNSSDWPVRRLRPLATRLRLLR